MKSPRLIGHKIEHFKETGSTNDIAKRRAMEGASEGTVIIADIQKAGRGRLERVWSSPPGGIWLSIILRPDMESERLSLLPLIAGNAVANTLNELFNVNAKVRWPNDVLIGKKKVSGILTELDMDENFVVMGIGINANMDLADLPEEVREIATTLKEELNREIQKSEILDRLFTGLEESYTAFNEGTPEISCSTINKMVKIITKGTEIKGKAIAIDSAGALIVQQDDGTKKRIISGDCTHIDQFA
jgi:BirA family biotin operon repressor/biotin-[acetyl-CoA-carboxylase] ligase